MRTWKRIPRLGRLIAFSLFLFAMAAGALVAGFAGLRELQPEGGTDTLAGNTCRLLFTEQPGSTAFRGRDRINILCLGIDYNYTEDGILYTKNARSDTMFVLSVEPTGRDLAVLSIPRDTRVFIPAAEAYEKINAAYSYGGVEEARRTVEDFLGVPIDHHVIVKVKGAGQLVDAVGGLEVDVEKDMDYDDSWGRLHIHLKQGRQVLHGEQAVGYCRFRMDEEGDRGRIRRQQQVMDALMARLNDPAIVGQIPAIVEAVRANVETDLPFTDMVDLALLYQNFDRRRLRTGQIEGDDIWIEEQSYIEPYYEPNRQLVADLLGGPPPPETLVYEDPDLEEEAPLVPTAERRQAEGERVEVLEWIPPVR